VGSLAGGGGGGGGVGSFAGSGVLSFFFFLSGGLTVTFGRSESLRSSYGFWPLADFGVGGGVPTSDAALLPAIEVADFGVEGGGEPGLSDDDTGALLSLGV
jgi:hypothetical protein